MSMIKSFKTHFFILFTIFVLVSNTGMWFMPNINMQYMISQNLLKVPFDDPNAHYLFLNYFQPFVFKIFGGKELLHYYYYTFFITLLFSYLFLYWFIIYHGKEISLNDYKLFLTIIFPTFMIPYYWVGMDGMTLLLMLLVLISLHHRFIPFLFASILSLQHFEQAFLSFGLLCATLFVHYIVTKEANSFSLFKKLLFLLAVLVFTRFLMLKTFTYIDAGIVGDRSSYLKANLQIFISMFKSGWYIILYTFFGVGWIVVLAYLKDVWPLFIAVAILFVVTMFVGDQTRVASIALFPSLFYWLFMNKELFIKITNKFISVLLLLYLIIPVIVVWGQPHYGSLWHYDMIAWQNIKNETPVDLMIPFSDSAYTISSKPLTQFLAKIDANTTQIDCPQNEQCSITLTVTNISNENWYTTGTYTVNLSYHILDQEHNLLQADGKRFMFPHTISSGVSVPMQVFIPNLAKGNYIIEFDLVQERVSWFSHKNKQNSLSLPLEIF